MALDFSHVVIGAGAIGLSIASRLAAPTTSCVARNVLLVEKNRHVGMETSSRNSEVIHAGLYYPRDSLKTKLCLKGKKMLYDLFDEKGIAYNRSGKWIVAQDAEQGTYLAGLKDKADSLDVPTRFLSSVQAGTMEPHIRVGECALESTTTGIMDSHGLMTYLRHTFQNDGGDVSLATSVTGITQIPGGYRLATTNAAGEVFEITTESVINSAGLAATKIANMILPPSEHLEAYFAKGQYYSYSGPHKPKRLIYPCPEKDLAGLGTHLTFDLSGNLRFGPDIEWITDPSDYSTSSARLDQVYDAVKSYYPSLERERLQVDYCGIRPKMSPAGAGATDFWIREESSRGLPGFVNLLGMESPGLTSCLAIAEHVEELLK